MSHGNEMICQSVTLSGYAEWPKVADAVIEAGKLATETGLAREALYRMLSEHGNPQLSSLEKILQVLGLRLAVTRLHKKLGMPSP